MNALIRAITLALVIFVMACAQAVAASPLDDAMAGYKYLQVERYDAILIVRIYNPPTNLLSAAMTGEIRDLVHRVDADTETRVVIFTDGVPDYFIQHYDIPNFRWKLGEFLVCARPPHQPRARCTRIPADSGYTGEFTKAPPNGVLPPPQYVINATDETFLDLEALSKPTIAAINGHAQGGGVELALACDFRIITDPGEIGFGEVTLGVLPGAGGTVRLPRLIGIARAKQMIMLGREIDAATAVRYGLAMKAVPPDQLVSESMQLAERLAALSPAALQFIKKVINASLNMSLKDELKLEDHSFDVLMRTEKAQRLVHRYLEQNQRWGASQEGLPP